jgi:RNA polymerase sigma-70 factor (ECF subfamily)
MPSDLFFAKKMKPRGVGWGKTILEGQPVLDEIQQLVEKCQSGDQAAMRSLIDRFSARVFALCCRLLHHREDAEDAAQESFVRMFKSLHTWDKKRPFEPWLLTIAANRCRTRLALQAKRPRSQQLEYPEAVSGGGDAEASQLREELRYAMKGLPVQHCEAFHYFHDQGLTYHQIAEIMEAPVGTIKTWVRRVRLILVDRLQARGVLEGAFHELQ